MDMEIDPSVFMTEEQMVFFRLMGYRLVRKDLMAATREVKLPQPVEELLDLIIEVEE